MESPARRAILEPIAPDPASFDAGAMASGAPGPPRRFTWRGRAYAVRAVLDVRRELTPCPAGPRRERYVRRHVYEVRVESGERMWISGSRGPGDRWLLRALAPAD